MGGVASHHEHELVLDVLGLSEPAFAVNSAHQIVAWNDGAERLLGLRAEEALGVRCYEALVTSEGTLCVECRFREGGPSAESARVASASDLRRADASQASQAGHTGRAFVSTQRSGRRAVIVTTLAARTHAGELRVVHLLREAPTVAPTVAPAVALGEAPGVVAEPAASVPRAALPAPQPLGLGVAHDAALGATGALDTLDTLDTSEAVGDPGASSGKKRRPALLTQRELEVLRLLGVGHSTDDIARELSITRVTARNHVNKVLDKLGVNSRLQAVVIASQLRLI